MLSHSMMDGNQLVGQLPSLKRMAALKTVAARSNYITAVAEAPPACPSYQLLLDSNCFAESLTICDEQQVQREAGWCKWFCGNEPLSPPCSGHGVCVYLPEFASAPTCSCKYGYTSVIPATCSPQGSYVPSLLTSYEDPMTLFQLATSTPNGSIFLTSMPSTASWGAAFTPQPITLFLSTNKKQPCEQPIGFSVSFTFRMTPATSGSIIAGEGLAFVVTAAAPQGAAAGVGLGGVGQRGVAVEFDSVLSVKHSDPNDNHVGVNVGGSPVSLASATAPLILNDGHTKHAWIHYDPTSGGTLRVFLSASRQQPSKAVVTARVSLCSALKPTVGNASFLFGFVAAALNKSQRHDILSWKITTGIPPFVDWQNEAPADSAAYAVVGAVEAAYSIASNLSQPLRLSVEQLRVALSTNCDDMPPRDVLAFLVAATRKGGGLVDDAAAAAASPHSMASAGRRERLAAKIKYYGIQGYEETSFDGWLGLLLAVQRQPVVVRIEASAQSFFEYDGTYKYADSGCFREEVNHAVLLVGYAVEGSTSSPFSLPGPLWVIRNSWGTGWGYAGHMFMDMQSGSGICGINTLPGIFPILRSTADPCGSKSVKLAGSWAVPVTNAFNPCGQFKCSKAGASNRCACAAPHFVQASHPDGSNTCAYGSNPCVVGTCVNDGKGNYSCVCPPGFVQGTTAKGALSCAPGDNKGSYTVLGSNVWCSQVLPVFGLTLDQLTQQNKACVDAVVKLNPGLNCSELMCGQTVCVERDESRAREVAVCDKEYLVQVCGGCDAVMAAVDPPLSPLEFYRLNPGINCKCLSTNLQYTYSRRKVRTCY
ncbi:unnamed protein product [Closterium sp. NIES-65]|nr:unnamed protein product [Closterium sp. NIES-65]